MSGYTITEIKNNYVYMEISDFHKGKSKTVMTTSQFIEKFNKDPIVGQIV